MKGLVASLVVVVWMCGCGEATGEVIPPEGPPPQNETQPALEPSAHVVGLEFERYDSGKTEIRKGAVGIRPDGALYLKGQGLEAEPLTPKGFAPPGAPLAISAQGKVLYVFLVDNAGQLCFVRRNEKGIWAPPSFLSKQDFAPPGAEVAVGLQGALQLDVFVVDTRGSVQVFYLYPGQPWLTHPISTADFASPGASLATGRQDNPDKNYMKLSVFVVDRLGVLQALSVIDGGAWSPSPLTKPGFAPPGANVATSQLGNLLGVLIVDGQGVLDFFHSTKDAPWSSASTLSVEQSLPAGARIATGTDYTGIPVAFVVDNQGVPTEFRSSRSTVWTGPKPLPGLQDNFARPGAAVSFFKINPDSSTPQDGLFISSTEGQILSTRGLGQDWTPPQPLW